MQPTSSALEQAARNVIQALAPEGRLQGEIELALQNRGSTVGSAEYYIEDAYTRVPVDGPLLKARLQTCTFGREQRLRVTRHAAFSWADEEIRLRCVQLFKAQPFNMLIRVDGVLSHEDVRSESRTPLWGRIDFHRTLEQLDRAFDREGKSIAGTLLKLVSKQARAIGRRRTSVPSFLPQLPSSTTAGPPQALRTLPNERSTL